MDARWMVRGFAALGMSMLACLPAQAQDAESIARIERGLRPAVAIQDAKLETRTLAAEMARLNVPGVSVAVIRGGKIAWAKGYGVTHANGAPVTPQTLFQAASISKPVAAMAAMKMVEAGQLELDADINTVLTSWKLPPGPAKRPAAASSCCRTRPAPRSRASAAMRPARRCLRCSRYWMAQRLRTADRYASKACPARPGTIRAAATP